MLEAMTGHGAMKVTSAVIFAILCVHTSSACAADNSTHRPYRPGVNRPPQPVLEGRTARPMRYKAEDDGFVIQNGEERFNRPLYIGHDGARLDAGDRPEFAFYLPGKGGVLRLGIASEGRAKWMVKADKVRACYRDGRMIYQVSDALLDGGHIQVQTVPAAGRTAAVMRITAKEGAAGDLLWSYGGATGERNFKGDIGYKDISRFYGLKAGECKGTTFDLQQNRFVLRRDGVAVTGLVSEAHEMQRARASKWNDLEALLSSDAGSKPVVTGRSELETGTSTYIALVRGAEEKLGPEELKNLFERSFRQKKKISNRIQVDTPDPRINALVPALCVAGDGLYDGSNWYMHGNVAWRTALPGWRCAYTGDALGWPDRTRDHILSSLRRQIKGSSAEPPARVKSEGYIKTAHYDMNLVVFDTLIRHLLWTGDREFAKKVWPNLEKHLAWEKRCFDRGGLYEAYPCIWGSDALQYSGGGAAHSTAYNFYENKMAARIARWIGKNPEPYEAEAARIHAAMQQKLWLEQEGTYAEYKDGWGVERRHPSAALWTVYHSIDSEVPNAFQAWQMLRDVETRLPHIPIHGRGVPAGDWSVVPLSSWMPYSWSINNVAAEETYHTALACWQSGRPQQAWRLFMGTALENMFRGICPGNAGMTLSFDAYRGECIRDFGDTIGIMSRAVVEGLFGVVPDALSRQVTIRPGWPEDWDHASFAHPSISYQFERQGQEDRYTIEPNFEVPMQVKLIVEARGTNVEAYVNGEPTPVQNVDHSIGAPQIRVTAQPAEQVQIILRWTGETPATSSSPDVLCRGEKMEVTTGDALQQEIMDPRDVLSHVQTGKHGFTARLEANPGHKTVFSKVRQGDWQWWEPVEFEVRPALEIATDYDGRRVPRNGRDNLQFRVRNNTRAVINDSVRVTVGNWTDQVSLKVPARSESEKVTISPEGLLPGRHTVEIKAGNLSARGTVVNWGPRVDRDDCALVDLTDTFNDRVSQIFKRGKYETPDLPPCSMPVPDSGIGHWCRPDAVENVNIEDSGLRSRAAEREGTLVLDSGVPFRTPSEEDARNVTFVSQWKNLPDERNISLSGRARHIYMLMVGSTHHMQSRFRNGEVVVRYADGSQDRLPLRNPTTWWPVERDYFIDDFAFRCEAARPPRLRLKTGEKYDAGMQLTRSRGVQSHQVSGGAATVLDLPLDSERELESLSLHATANEVVIGVMGITLVR